MKPHAEQFQLFKRHEWQAIIIANIYSLRTSYYMRSVNKRLYVRTQFVPDRKDMPTARHNCNCDCDCEVAMEAGGVKTRRVAATVVWAIICT